MSESCLITPVVVPFENTEAHLYYGMDRFSVLKSLSCNYAHLIWYDPGKAAPTDIYRLIGGKHFRLGSVKTPDRGFGACLDGCCPECGALWALGISVETMEEVPMATCSHRDLTPIPCTVLDLDAGDGTNGAKAVRMGLKYIGIQESCTPALLGQAVKKIQGEAP